jgi:hypothetical protein
VVNAGTIAAEGMFAISLQDGGSVINQSGGVIGGLSLARQPVRFS